MLKLQNLGAYERQRRRVERQQRRLDRERRRLLAVELAEYNTPAERTELELILARSPDEDVREIEDLLPRRSH
jgi:hypothetical protein